MITLDPRLILVVLTVGDTVIQLDQSFDISGVVMKYANAYQNECQLRIANLSRDKRNELATQFTPWNFDQRRKTVQVYIGRESTGLFLIYQGDITECAPTQPPTIVLRITSRTLQWLKYSLMAQAQNVTANLSTIQSDIAKSLGVESHFEATDRLVKNYSYSGAAEGQVQHLGQLGAIDAYVDDNKLICKDRGAALKNSNLAINVQTGMIGIPELTEYGVRVRKMTNEQLILGGGITLTSTSNPSLNGDYTSYRIGYQFASRDTAFYGVIEASKFPVLMGAAGGLSNVVGA